MLRLRMRSLFRKNKVEAELDDELAFHLEELVRENVAAGMSAAEARCAALRAMGGIAQFKEECRDARGVGLIEGLLQDLRYGARVLRRTPAFSATAVACLALGIGASAAMFTVINAVLLRPLPFREPGRLVGVWEETQMFGLHYSPANVANLMLSRAVARGKEVAIRVALGAGGVRVARQILAEHLLLAATGGTAGTLLAFWSVRFLKHLVPGEIAALVPLELDWRVLLFAVVLTAGTCILFSLAPVAQALRTDVNEALKAAAERAGRSRGSQTLRRALVVAETALALVLLIGAGLMIRTFAQLRGIDPGFPTHNLLTMKTPVWSGFREPADRQRYYDQVLGRVRSLPGVVSAGFTLGIPIDFKGWFSGARTETMTEMQAVLFRVCTPDYLRTMGIRVVKGRPFTDADDPHAPLVALVNETLARQFWPDRDPIGRRLYEGMSGQGLTVVSVVADVKQSGLDVPPKPEYYQPQRQNSAPASALVIRTAVEPLSLASAVRREIRAVDKETPITGVQTMEDILDREVFQRRFQMLILAFFAGGALLLASVGIYGVLSYLVAQRRHEIGLRMALGAASSDILKNVFGQAATLMATGLAIGLAASLALTRMMSNLLFGVTATDPATFIGVPLVLFAVGLAASYIPARRAMKVDPSLTLRDE